MINPMDLSGKRILLVGDSSKLDNVLSEQILSLGGCVYRCEFLNLDDIENQIKSHMNDTEAFDGFVFNIVHSDFRPLKYVKPALVDSIMHDNYGAFIEVMRVLKKLRGLAIGASVVAISSISSIRAMKAKMAFCSAKAALDAAIRCLALELTDKAIRVNSIQKGVVDSDFEKGHIQDVASINDGEAEKKTPLGPSSAVEIANVVAFLLSDATKTITGTSIVIDGGYTL